MRPSTVRTLGRPASLHGTAGKGGGAAAAGGNQVWAGVSLLVGPQTEREEGLQARPLAGSIPAPSCQAAATLLPSGAGQLVLHIPPPPLPSTHLPPNSNAHPQHPPTSSRPRSSGRRTGHTHSAAPQKVVIAVERKRKRMGRAGSAHCTSEPLLVCRTFGWLGGRAARLVASETQERSSAWAVRPPAAARRAPIETSPPLPPHTYRPAHNVPVAHEARVYEHHAGGAAVRPRACRGAWERGQVG